MRRRLGQIETVVFGDGRDGFFVSAENACKSALDKGVGVLNPATDELIGVTEPNVCQFVLGSGNAFGFPLPTYSESTLPEGATISDAPVQTAVAEEPIAITPAPEIVTTTVPAIAPKPSRAGVMVLLGLIAASMMGLFGKRRR